MRTIYYIIIGLGAGLMMTGCGGKKTGEMEDSMKVDTVIPLDSSLLLENPDSNEFVRPENKVDEVVEEVEVLERTHLDSVASGEVVLTSADVDAVLGSYDWMVERYETVCGQLAAGDQSVKNDYESLKEDLSSMDVLKTFRLSAEQEKKLLKLAARMSAATAKVQRATQKPSQAETGASEAVLKKLENIDLDF